jgi:DNA repair protein SbcC/Rad50
MRSLELELEGFTSFRSRQNLDFSHLDLFAITGPTGAGKTSLLDAITFALYGHVARFGKDATARELVSQGKENLKVSFRFSVRGVEYRVTRTWRKRGKTDESKALLEALQNDTWEKLETKDKSVTKRVEQLLGMDFDTFTRVILLPQGKFDEFIKGRKDKRREILRDLAGFEIFERMRKQAYSQADVLKNRFQSLEEQLGNLALPTFDEMAAKEQELATIEQQLPILNQEVVKAQKALDEAEELFKHITRLAKLQYDLNQLNAKGVEIDNFKVSLQQAQAADQIKGQYALVQDSIHREIQTQTAALSAQQRLTQAKQNLEKQKAKLDEFITKQQEIEAQFKAREVSLNAAKNYELQRQQHQTELERVNKNQTQRQNNLTSAAQALNDVQNNLQAATKQVEDAEKALIQYSVGGTRLQQLQQVSSLLGTWKVVQEQTVKSRNKLEQITSEKQKYEKIYQDAIVKLEQARLALQERNKFLQEAEETNKKAIQGNHAAALRQILHDGDNCPVCNSTYQEAELLALPEVALVDTTELLQHKTTAEQAQKAAENAVTKAETTLENLKQQELGCSQDLAVNDANLTDLKQQISAVLYTDSWEADAINQELKILQENATKYHQALANQKDAKALVHQTQQTLESTRNTHDIASGEYQAATQEAERWQQLLQEIEFKLNQITGGKSYTDLHATLEKEKQVLQQQLQQITESYQAGDKRVIQCETENKEASNNAEAARIQKEQLQTTWNAALKDAGFTEENFMKAQAESAQQASWQKEITNYVTEKVQLETRVEEVKLQVCDRTTDESTINFRRDAKNTAYQQFQQVQDQRANLKAWINETKSKQQQAEKLEADLSKVKEQAQTYSTLARNLKSDEFQAYILEHLETDLVTRATDALRELTDSRYALKLQDGDYWVEDNWNGGESRRVQTLSGGEIFATSLSMALALSEKLSMGAELGSLFLDEGFGTLDGDTLESVSQILESLRQQDKLIGIITHVKALGERLPTQVKVRKSPEGSKIEVEAF